MIMLMSTELFGVQVCRRGGSLDGLMLAIDCVKN